MKNKKLLFILIPCTLLLWGMILYKIFSAVSGNDDNMAQNQKILVLENSQEHLVADTFSIHPTYRDPFSSKINKTTLSTYTGNSTPKTPSSPKPIVSSSSSINNTFPKIIYGGMIKNKQSNKQLVLIQINGQSNIMKIGDIVNEVELTKAFRDSIEVKFGKEKRFIVK